MLLLFAVMTWLVIHPGEFVTETLKLYNFRDVEFKFLLVALAALNFFLCFVIEVSQDLVILAHHMQQGYLFVLTRLYGTWF